MIITESGLVDSFGRPETHRSLERASVVLEYLASASQMPNGWFAIATPTNQEMLAQPVMQITLLNREIANKRNHLLGNSEVPGWVVSFGDMITNLLACFVLMQSLASAQEESLFSAGIGSFKRVVKSYGLASHLKNRAREEVFDYRKIKYPTEESSDQALQRVINPRDDQIRQKYDDMRKLMNTSAQDARRRVVVARPVSAVCFGIIGN